MSARRSTSHRNPLIGLAALAVLGMASVGCTDDAATLRSSANPGPDDPVPAVRAEPAPQAARAEQPAPAPLPPPVVAPLTTEAQPARALDADAVRALAEEVARLRADLAAMSAELEATRRGAEDEQEAVADVPLISDPLLEGDGEPLESGARPEPHPLFGGAEDTAVASDPGTEPVSEREIIIEREIEVPGATEIVVFEDEPAPTVVYEQVVYETEIVYQYVPFGHVHHIGCGHHYYGCSCHSWYYDMRGSVSFHVSDHDWDIWIGHGHPYTYYHYGYWRRGYDYDHHDHVRHTRYAAHHDRHAAAPGGRNRAKRSFRQGFRDGFEDGRESGAVTTPTAPVTTGRRGASDRGDRGGRSVATERTRTGVVPGRGALPGSAPRVRGAEDPSAGRTVQPRPDSRNRDEIRNGPAAPDVRSRRSIREAAPSSPRTTNPGTSSPGTVSPRVDAPVRTPGRTRTPAPVTTPERARIEMGGRRSNERSRSQQPGVTRSERQRGRTEQAPPPPVRVAPTRQDTPAPGRRTAPTPTPQRRTPQIERGQRPERPRATQPDRNRTRPTVTRPDVRPQTNRPPTSQPNRQPNRVRPQSERRPGANRDRGRRNRQGGEEQ